VRRLVGAVTLSSGPRERAVQALVRSLTASRLPASSGRVRAAPRAVWPGVVGAFPGLCAAGSDQTPRAGSPASVTAPRERWPLHRWRSALLAWWPSASGRPSPGGASQTGS